MSEGEHPHRSFPKIQSSGSMTITEIPVDEQPHQVYFFFITFKNLSMIYPNIPAQ